MMPLDSNALGEKSVEQEYCSGDCITYGKKAKLCVRKSFYEKHQEVFKDIQVINDQEKTV